MIYKFIYKIRCLIHRFRGVSYFIIRNNIIRSVSRDKILKNEYWFLTHQEALQYLKHRRYLCQDKLN